MTRKRQRRNKDNKKIVSQRWKRGKIAKPKKKRKQQRIRDRNK
jgi:hypothetical protein